MKYSGIELHSNNSVVTVTDEENRVVAEKRLPNVFIAARLILMGARRDTSQPWFEETGVIGICKRWMKRMKTGGWRRHGFVHSLALGWPMGVAYYLPIQAYL